ncbi:sensor histidine kinase [Streptomyces sp. NPDC051664]|uniref:sensor histidine kinase n=1 Tax=Streptomyces sp. NPDC051664 TaxID=3365668 RepID=UPI0037A85352
MTALTVLVVSAMAGVLLFLVQANLPGAAQRSAAGQIRLAEKELRQGASIMKVRHDAPDISVNYIPTGDLVAVPSETGKGLARDSDAPVPVSDLAAGADASNPTEDDGPVGASPDASPHLLLRAVAPSPPTDITVSTDKGLFELTISSHLTPTRIALRTTAWALLPTSLLLLLSITALTWYAMGRALRPVEAIRTEFAEITATNLEHRVPVSPSGDEIAVLAETMNVTLDQLHRAVNRLKTFTSDASHELRGPLTTLRARMEIAMMFPEKADWPLVVDESLSDATRLEEIVQDLLFLARLDMRQPLNGEPIPISGFLQKVRRELYAKRPVVLIGSLPELDVSDVVLGNRSSLTRMLTNLIDNALRHTTQKVDVEVTISPGKVVIEVRDDGLGIPEEDREIVFDRFVRLDDARTANSGGTGLGLAIARDVCVAHGGDLTARAPLPGGTGARLVVELPTTDSAPCPEDWGLMSGAV